MRLVLPYRFFLLALAALTLGAFATAPLASGATPNRKPSCKDLLNEQTAEDTALQLQLACSDADRDSLTYRLVQEPDSGTAVIAANGATTYTPAANYSGTDSFTYRANDGTVDSEEKTVLVTVSPINDAPVCEAQALTTTEDAKDAVTGTFVCTDIEGGVLTYALAAPQAEKGDVVLTVDATGFSYDSNPNLNGDDAFGFTASDGSAVSATALVSVTITPVNDPPSCDGATPGSPLELQTQEETSVAFSYSGCSDIDGDHLRYTPGAARHGRVEGSGENDRYSFVPETDYFGDGAEGTGAGFTTAVSDQSGGTTEFKTTVAVTPVNDAPVCQTHQLAATEDLEATEQIASCSDIDSANLTYSIDNARPPALRAGANVDSKGNITYQPAPDASGTDSFGFTATDGESTVSGTVNVTIAAVNDAPQCHAQADLITTEDNEVEFRTLCSDVEGDPISYAASQLEGHQPTKGQVAFDGALGTYTPNLDANGSDKFAFIAHDGVAASAAVAVAVTIAAVEDAPRCTAARATLATNEDTKQEFNPQCTDPEGQSVTVTASGAQKGELAVASDTGIVTYSPHVNATGEDTFTVTASDGVLSSDPIRVVVSIAAVNDAPSCDPVAEVTIEEDTFADVDLICSDVDGDSLTYSAGVASRGEVTHEANVYQYVPTANYHGGDSFTAIASDGQSADEIRVKINVTPVEDAPTCDSGSATLNEDASLEGTLSCTDGDVEDLPVAYEQVSSAANGTVAINTTTGVYTYTPAANYNGADSFRFRARSGARGEHASPTAVINLQVQPVNDAPTCASITALQTAEDTSVTVPVSCNDIDGDTLEYHFSDPANGTVASAGGNHTYTPDSDYNGSDTFELTASDGSTSSPAVEASVTVTAVDDRPTCSNTRITVGEDTTATGSANCSDADGDELDWSVASAAASGVVTLDAATGGYTYAPDANFAGDDSFVVQVEDSTGLTASATVTAEVAAVNDAPTCEQPNAASTDEGTAVSIDVSCQDVDGDALILRTSEPLHGSTTVDRATVRYMPASGYSGDDSFQVAASDGGLESAAVTATVTVRKRVVATVTTPTGTTTSSTAAAATVPTPSTAPDTAPPTGVTTPPAAPRLLQVIRRGLPVRVSCSEACGINVTMAVANAKVARRMGLPRGGVIGSGKAQLAAAGTARPVISLTRKAKRAVRNTTSLRVRLTVTRTDALGNRRSTSSLVTLRRS